jgi:hypothetical protein
MAGVEADGFDSPLPKSLPQKKIHQTHPILLFYPPREPPSPRKIRIFFIAQGILTVLAQPNPGVVSPGAHNGHLGALQNRKITVIGIFIH